MKLYNQNWPRNRDVIRYATRWQRQGLLSADQMDQIRQDFPIDYWQPNSFVEIGLFLFTMVAVVGGYALLALLLGDLFETTFGLFNLLMAVGVGGLAYWLINTRQYYRNGVDSALIIAVAALAVAAVTSLLPPSPPFWTICAIALPVLLALIWYSGDTLVSFVALAMFYGLIVDALLNAGWGRLAMPFVLMGVSELIFQLARRADRQPYYADALNLTEWVALIVLAAGGNYFVVREVNGLLLPPGTDRSGGAPEIALAGLFWLLTVAIPVAYLWQGFARKNRMLIILGILGLVAAVATLHNYAALVPLNAALTIGGLALAGTAALGIRYLRQPRNGFTDAPDDESPNEVFVNAASIAISQATSVQQSPKPGVRFGGGEFGGGGAGERY